ncbi:helix-turn-helix domain-containing protein [Longibacter sp.]|jgi:transcriptional regulator with XRE-family HTH domain|uniref:helix-turn-helix domain-containing protein n=1 Tax=Longibacter sp. TaxID=2045415 RepID=UPI003EB89405
MDYFDDQFEVGAMIRRWRTHRGMSQMDLALDADLSARHVSFVETGRSTPSREALFALTDALDVPLRERNVVFEAAGFARPYSEATLSESELAHHRQLVASILQRHDPFFAVAIDRHWNVRMANRPGEEFLNQFFGPGGIEEPSEPNLARLLFHPAGLRSCIVNWPEASAHFYDRLHRESVHNPLDEDLALLLDEIASYGDFAKRPPTPSRNPALVLQLSMDGMELRLIGSVLAFDSAQAPALEELRIETFFPADERTARQLEARPLAD